MQPEGLKIAELAHNEQNPVYPPCPLALGVMENGFQDCVGDGKLMHRQLVCITGCDCPARAGCWTDMAGGTKMWINRERL